MARAGYGRKHTVKGAVAGEGWHAMVDDAKGRRTMTVEATTTRGRTAQKAKLAKEMALSEDEQKARADAERERALLADGVAQMDRMVRAMRTLYKELAKLEHHDCAEIAEAAMIMKAYTARAGKVGAVAAAKSSKP